MTPLCWWVLGHLVKVRVKDWWGWKSTSHFLAWVEVEAQVFSGLFGWSSYCLKVIYLVRLPLLVTQLGRAGFRWDFFCLCLVAFSGCQLLYLPSLGLWGKKNSPPCHSMAPEVPSWYALFSSPFRVIFVLCLIFKVFSCSWRDREKLSLSTPSSLKQSPTHNLFL